MNILKTITILFFLTCSLFASNILPKNKLQASGAVTDMVISNSKLYVSTDASKVDIFDLNSQKIVSTITIDKITDFMGDIINSKIYSVDVIDEKVLILSQGKKGGRNISLYENGTLTNLVSDEKRMFIARAKFISSDKILFSLLSNQLYLYDIKNKKFIYKKQISQSKFSYFHLNEDKSKVVIADESGNIQIYDTLLGKLIKIHKNHNLDNIFQVDYKNNKIITAGQDRRTVVYDKNNIFIKESNFLIYSASLSPSGEFGAFSSNENNDVTVFDTQTEKNLFILKDNKMTLTKILFINENELFVSSDDSKINYYKLKD